MPYEIILSIINFNLNNFTLIVRRSLRYRYDLEAEINSIVQYVQRTVAAVVLLPTNTDQGQNTSTHNIIIFVGSYYWVLSLLNDAKCKMQNINIIQTSTTQPQQYSKDNHVHGDYSCEEVLVLPSYFSALILHPVSG
jgi:hypothetical protein